MLASQLPNRQGRRRKVSKSTQVPSACSSLQESEPRGFSYKRPWSVKTLSTSQVRERELKSQWDGNTLERTGYRLQPVGSPIQNFLKRIPNLSFSIQSKSKTQRYDNVTRFLLLSLVHSNSNGAISFTAWDKRGKIGRKPRSTLYFSYWPTCRMEFCLQWSQFKLVISK